MFIQTINTETKSFIQNPETSQNKPKILFHLKIKQILPPTLVAFVSILYFKFSHPLSSFPPIQWE